MSSRTKTPGSGLWVSATLSVLAGWLYWAPELALRLEYDRPAIVGGELWRLLTGHFTHWSGEHLFLDLLVFAVAAGVWERLGGRRRLLVCLLASALAVSLSLWFLLPQVVHYRGLSGVDCALVTAVAVESIRRARAQRRPGVAVALAGVLAVYLFKIGYELATGTTLFLDAAAVPAGNVPLVHVVGGVCGLLAVVVSRRLRPADRGLEVVGDDDQMIKTLVDYHSSQATIR